MRFSDEVKVKISKALKNKKQSVAHVINKTLSRFNKFPKIRKKILKHRIFKRPIEGIDLNTGIVLEFNSISEATKYGFRQGGITRSLKSSCKHKGYYWRDLV